MTARNDVTGDLIQSKVVTDKFREQFDLIFGKPKANKPCARCGKTNPADIHTCTPIEHQGAADNGADKS